MPLSFEDATPPNISGDPEPTRPLPAKQMAGAMKSNVNRMRTGAQPSAPRGKAQSQQEPNGDQQESEAEAKPQVAQAGAPQRQSPKLSLEEQKAIQPAVNNPWFPVESIAGAAEQAGSLNPLSDPQTGWYMARHVGMAWNSLFDPGAESSAVHDLWSRNDAVAKAAQYAMQLPFYEHGNPGQVEWFWQNFGPMVFSAPAYFNPISGTAAIGLSMAGQGPEQANQIPGALASGLPIAELGTVAKHPEQIKDPEIATKIFWKSANAALLGASVLPMTSWLRGLRAIKPEALEDMVKSAQALKPFQTGDPAHYPQGKDLLQHVLGLRPIPDTTVFKKAASDVRQMKVEKGQYIDQTLRQRKQIAQDLGMSSWQATEELPHLAPQWTPAQVKLAKKALPTWVNYDLVRKYAKEIPPENPWDLLDQVSDEHKPDAMNHIHMMNAVLLHLYRGPGVDPLNSAESMVQSLFGEHTATEYMLTKYYYPSWQALAEKAGVNNVDLMRALRSPEAYDKLSAEGKVLLNAEKIVRRAYAEMSKDFGHRTGFIPNYDPRVKIEPKAEFAPTRGRRLLVGESKAHRQEKFAPLPDDPSQIGLYEAHSDVFALNKAMRASRDSYVRETTKTGAYKALEEKARNVKGHGFFKALKAQEELNRWDKEGINQPSEKDLAAARTRAEQLYPLYHEDLMQASMRSMGQQIKALHSHIGAEQAIRALAQDGRPLAYHVGDRGIPKDYQNLENAGRAMAGLRFHPDFAKPFNRVSHRLEEGPLLGAFLKANQGAVSALMFSIMIHGMNMADRVAWLGAKDAVGGFKGKSLQQGAEIVTHTRPWAALEKALGFNPVTDQERLQWQLEREMEAIRAGVIPHFNARGLGNLLWSEYGRVMGDEIGFDRPGERDLSKLPKAMQSIPELGQMLNNGYQWYQNLLWGRIVWPVGVYAFHVERAALKAVHPDLPDLAIDQMAAHMANRWQGAIEPMARSQGMNLIYRTLGFAINWMRSFYELALPSYLAKSAVAAHPELKGYILRQEMQILVGMLGAQHISGNILNMIMSGHPQWENEPQNRYYVEITRPEVIRGLQALGLYKNIDPNTGIDPSTGGRLVMENFMARQQLQQERLLGLEPGTSPVQGWQDLAAGHLAPIWDAFAAAANVNLSQTVLAGELRHENPVEGAGPHWDTLLPALESFLGVSSTFGYQTQRDISGRAQQADQLPSFLQNAPVPDAIKRYAAPGLQAAFNWMTGIRPPYVRAGRTQGAPVSDANYVAYDQLKKAYDKDMTQWSHELTTGQITPYEWRQRYTARAHEYAIRSSQLFQGASEPSGGGLGLYSQYQALYSQAQLPDGTGIDWAKLDGLQADFTSKLTAAQQADLQTQIGKHENAYPALAMYRSTIDSHTQMTKEFAQQHNITYGQFEALREQYGTMDRVAARQFESQHPELREYFAAEEQWETNTWAGRQYSLYYHTAALKRWLIPEEGADTPAAEEKAEAQIEQHFHLAQAGSGG